MPNLKSFINYKKRKILIASLTGIFSTIIIALITTILFTGTDLFKGRITIFQLVFLMLFISWSVYVVKLINNFFTYVIIKKLYNEYFTDLLDIATTTKLPEKLPKVVWCYTTHNDFMPARVLQSMKQTYKNFEIWISDGSDKEECKKELDAFCKEHKINLFRLGGSGSKNKADNTNKFLKYSGVDFDYLLITDADAVVHKNFVETSVKMFLSKKFPRLAWVSTNGVVYDTNTWFNNTLNFTESDVNRNVVVQSFADNGTVDVGGICCLLSKEIILRMGNQFPDSNVEDGYTTLFGDYNELYGAYNIMCPVCKELDRSFSAFLSRIARIRSWMVKITMRNPYKKMNTHSLYFSHAAFKYTTFHLDIIVKNVGVFLFILMQIFLYQYIDKILFWSNLIVVTSCFCLNFLSAYIVECKNVNFYWYLRNSICTYFFYLAHFFRCCKVVHMGIINDHYLGFGGSGAQRTKSTNKVWLNIKWYFWTFLITLIMCVGSMFLFLYYNGPGLYWPIYIFITLYSPTLFVMLCCGSYIMFNLLSSIKYRNGYSSLDPINISQYKSSDHSKLKNLYYDAHNTPMEERLFD